MTNKEQGLNFRNNVILHFNRGTTDLDGDGHYDCIPAVDNFQIISGDEGGSWGEVSNISSYLGDSRGLLPGPGTGAYLEESDRIVMAGHFQTAEREDGRVVIYYSDDGGLTYSLAPSGRFPRADEAMVAHTGGSNLTVNLSTMKKYYRPTFHSVLL